MAIAVMVTWVCNFIVSKETPIIVLHIGWKTWLASLRFINALELAGAN